MTRSISILFIATILTLSSTVVAQPWNSLLPKEKVETNNITFFDMQQAFNDYWNPKNVIDGYYYVNGIKTKAGGWKQFKRWEWYWENRVNPITGAFPNTSAWEESKKISSSLNVEGSPSGLWKGSGPSTSPGGYAGLGRLNCIGFHPTDNNTMYVGAAAGGIWKTTDGCTTWNPKGDDIETIGVSDIVVLQTAGDDIIYVATGDKNGSNTYSVGVLKSINGGDTWQNTGLSFSAGEKKLINRLLVDPLNNNFMYAATSEGVYRSTDSGDTWGEIFTLEFADMEFKPGEPNIIYGSTKNGDIYRSADGGWSWNNVLSTSWGRRTEMAVSPDNPNIVYALIANTNSALYGIYKSTNSGSNFSIVYDDINLLGWDCAGGGTSGQAWYDLCIASDPNNGEVVYIGGINTWKSIDGGETWMINNHWSSTCSGSVITVHADKHYLAFQNNSSTLFECNDGGLYNTYDGGTSWNHLTNGMVISQMYRLGVAQTTHEDVITGLQDNGTKAMLNSVWTDVLGGDGMECLIDYSDENIQYGSLYFGEIFRTINHWTTSGRISNGISGNAGWVTPYLQDPNISTTLYVGYQDVWKSTNQGANWTKISNWNGDILKSLVVAPSNSIFIYAATSSSIFRTNNGGTTWTDITGSLPTWASYITYISVKYDNPNTIWVSMGQYNDYNVFESTDGGSTWTDISAGLPTLPTNCVIQNHQNTEQVDLYAATDVGVYVKLGDSIWAPYSADLPNVVVTELEIYYDDNSPRNTRLQAATFGRGLWESDLYSPTSILSADFEGSPTIGEAPLLVEFSDLSTGNINNWLWNFGDGEYSFVQNPTHEYVTPGNFTVSLTISSQCNTDSIVKTDYILIPVSLSENSSESIIVYPNPVTDNLHIIFPDIKSRNIILNNVDGKQVLWLSTNQKEEILDIENFSTGIYSLIISSDDDTISVIKVVKN